MYMVNYQTDKSTELLWQDDEFDAGLKDSDFTKNILQRTR